MLGRHTRSFVRNYARVVGYVRQARSGASCSVLWTQRCVSFAVQSETHEKHPRSRCDTVDYGGRLQDGHVRGEYRGGVHECKNKRAATFDFARLFGVEVHTENTFKELRDTISSFMDKDEDIMRAFAASFELARRPSLRFTLFSARSLADHLIDPYLRYHPLSLINLNSVIHKSLLYIEAMRPVLLATVRMAEEGFDGGADTLVFAQPFPKSNITQWHRSASTRTASFGSSIQCS